MTSEMTRPFHYKEPRGNSIWTYDDGRVSAEGRGLFHDYMDPYLDNPLEYVFLKFGTECLWCKGKKTKIAYTFSRIADELRSLVESGTGAGVIFSMQTTAGAKEARRKEGQYALEHMSNLDRKRKCGEMGEAVMRRYIENACREAGIEHIIEYVTPEEFARPERREERVGKWLDAMRDGKAVWINEPDKDREHDEYDQGITKVEYYEDGKGNRFDIGSIGLDEARKAGYRLVTEYKYNTYVDLKRAGKKGGITFDCNDGLAGLTAMTAAELVPMKRVGLSYYMDNFGIFPRSIFLDHDKSRKYVRDSEDMRSLISPERIITIVKRPAGLEMQTIHDSEHITQKQRNSRGGLIIKAIWAGRAASRGVRTCIGSGMIGKQDHKNFQKKKKAEFFPIKAVLENMWPATYFLPSWHPLYPADF